MIIIIHLHKSCNYVSICKTLIPLLQSIHIHSNTLLQIRYNHMNIHNYINYNLYVCITIPNFLEQPLLLYLENQFTTDIGKTSTLNQK